jgi:hypothetical protein
VADGAAPPADLKELAAAAGGDGGGGDGGEVAAAEAVGGAEAEARVDLLAAAPAELRESLLQVTGVHA